MSSNIKKNNKFENELKKLNLLILINLEKFFISFFKHMFINVSFD